MPPSWSRDTDIRASPRALILEHLVSGDVDTGRSILGTYVNATLATRSGKSPKSLLRMLGPSGNPTADNLFEIIRILKDHEKVQLEIRLKAGERVLAVPHEAPLTFPRRSVKFVGRRYLRGIPILPGWS